MSVFSDFQRMWVSRFPQISLLSDAWEIDVRASLQRHKQKITELSKELEQETLYVEYLERLLSDVEKYRAAGGELMAPTAVEQQQQQQQQQQQCQEQQSPIISSSSSSKVLDVKNKSIITAASNDPINNKSLINKANGGGTGSGVTTGDDDDKDHENEKDKALLQLGKEGALNKCINELSTNLRRCLSEMPENRLKDQEMTNRRSSQNDSLLKAPSHFVTVIEVKETTVTTNNSNNDNDTNSNNENNNINNNKNNENDNNNNNNNNNNNKNNVININSVSNNNSNNDSNDNNVSDEDKISENVRVTSTDVISSFRDSGSINSNVSSNDRTSATLLDKKIKPTAPPISAAALEVAKKKVPPRPPPKYIRRAAHVDPPTVPVSAAINIRKDVESPSSSLERNVKPSEIFRQKSSDSLDVKTSALHRKTTPDMTRYVPKSTEIILDEHGRKVQKSESLEKNKRPAETVKRTESPTGSTGKTIGGSSGGIVHNSSPTGSLSKFSNTQGIDSPTGSLGKISNRATNDSLQSVGSKESLASQGTSERIKSYESISSLSSDSMKIGSHHLENEPYYDTVPVDGTADGEYVYIQAGGTAAAGTTGTMSSQSGDDNVSNAGSTLPLPAYPRTYNNQTSVLTEPESPGRSSNYVNIDYFLSQNHEARSSSVDSDGEADPPALMRAISHDEQPHTPKSVRKSIDEHNRSTSIRYIVTSIINSETLYVECLNKMMQYMKAIRATLTTSQPVISEEEFQTMFFKIDELYCVHTKFLNDLKIKMIQDGDIYVGECIKELVGHIYLYGAFLHNYGRAIDTVKKCGANNQQFKEIVSKIILNSQNEQSLTLEDLLHKPVARVQKNALVLQDLINETPQNHPDYQPLRYAQKIMRNFLSEFNVVQTKSLVPSDDKALRRLVKNSFIVELADGHRKLRHLFLFNDVIACAKYKASGRDRFEFDLKWFISLKDICIYEESSFDPKETSPINILQLKSQACTVRDQILLEERDEKKQRSYGSRASDKHRKKLHDLEAQLVLASPNLIFRIGNKSTSKAMTFFLSSDYERSQWIDSIMSLQQSCNLPGAQQVNIYDLQAWIAACQTLIKTEMGSYLLRNSRDESLLVGDLHLTIHGLTGVEHAADFYICVEIDSYGHYFRKAKTKLVCRSASPLWNESFILELEGSQNVRILLYEDHSPRQMLKARYVLKLSRQWLQESHVNRVLKLSDTITLNTTLRFVPGEVSLRRVPTSKPGALFGAKMQQVLKREKRDIPFIISACIREVERRGMCEVGIYRVSGSASDLARLKKSFESNNYEAEQLLKEVDIHSVTGILKSYLRELPEALFTDLLYSKFYETYNNKFNAFNEASRIEALLKIYNELPIPNKSSISYILDHLIRVHQKEAENKMSLHNLAMVFGPTLLRPGPQIAKQKDLLESSTMDVMTQAGILYCFFLDKTSK